MFGGLFILSVPGFSKCVQSHPGVRTIARAKCVFSHSSKVSCREPAGERRKRTQGFLGEKASVRSKSTSADLSEWLKEVKAQACHFNSQKCTVFTPGTMSPCFMKVENPYDF